MFFFGFLAVLTPSWRHFGSILAAMDPILARVWEVFWAHVGSIFGAKLPLCWAFLAQELALDGLVGLREAQRIIIHGCITYSVTNNIYIVIIMAEPV